MNRTLRIASITLFSLTILFFLLYIISRITIATTSLEFKDNGAAFDQFQFQTIPLAFLASISGLVLLKKKDTVKIIFWIGTAVTAAFISLVIFFLSAFNMCASNYHELYINKKNPSIRIVESRYGCGATDSTPDILTIVKIQEYPFGLISVDQIDTNQINRANWRKAN